MDYIDHVVDVGIGEAGEHPQPGRVLHHEVGVVEAAHHAVGGVGVGGLAQQVAGEHQARAGTALTAAGSKGLPKVWATHAALVRGERASSRRLTSM